LKFNELMAQCTVRATYSYSELEVKVRNVWLKRYLAWAEVMALLQRRVRLK